MLDSIKEIDIQLLSVLIGVAGTIFAIFIRDFVLEIVKENRSRKQSQLTTFKHYANPVIKSCESLSWRLKEILDQRGAVLLDRNAKNEFFRYKYISTLYRICTVIGWITAIKKEFAYIDPASKKSSKSIEKSLFQFRKSLADGQHMELSILLEISNIWQIDLSALEERDKALLAVKMESIAYNYIDKNKILTAKDLGDSDQKEMLNEIAIKICNYVDCPNITDTTLIETQDSVITEISRIEAWIYRDWQDAIGEVMLSGIESDTRRFDVIDYGTFERMFEDEEKWLMRIERLIADLDVSIDDKYDARTKQLKNIFKSNVDLIVAFNSVNKQSGTIREESIKKLAEYKKALLAT
jgi:hypothetical protein